MDTKPTDNADAYVFYLRARQYENSPDTLLQDYRAAEQLYGDAIALDPKFALAHAGLSTTRAAIFHYYEPTDAWKDEGVRARRRRRSACSRNWARGISRSGFVIIGGERDYERALLEFGAALAATA